MTPRARASFIDFPPMQAAASFNMEALKQQIDAGGSRAGAPCEGARSRPREYTAPHRGPLWVSCGRQAFIEFASRRIRLGHHKVRMPLFSTQRFFVSRTQFCPSFCQFSLTINLVALSL